jgi:site-specific recombinase XerD
MDWLNEVVHAKKPRKLPVVLTGEKVKEVLKNRSGVSSSMASVLYAFGLRLIECIGLRLKDVDVASHHVVVRDGAGANTG